MVCKLCKDLGYTVVEGKRKPCLCKIHKKIHSTYPFLNGVHCPEESLELAFKHAQELPVSKKICLRTYLTMQGFYVQLAIYFINNKITDYKIFNAYELIDIFLGKHPDYKSFFSIRTGFLVLTFGWNEFENKRQEDVILQMLDICKTRFVPVLFCLKPWISEKAYPLMFRYLHDNQFDFVGFSSKKTKLYSE